MITQLDLFSRPLPTARDRVIDWESLSGLDIAALDDATHRRFVREYLEPACQRIRRQRELKRWLAYHRAHPPIAPDPEREAAGF